MVELRRGPAFTDRARQVLGFSLDEARRLNHDHVGTEHILLGLLGEGERDIAPRGRDVAGMALADLDVSLVTAREKVEETMGRGTTAPPGSPPFTVRAKKVLELSAREAFQLGHEYIGTEHILLGIVREGEGGAAKLLVSMGADLARVRQQIIHRLSGYRGKGQAGAQEHEQLWNEALHELRSGASVNFLARLIYQLTLSARSEYGPEGTMPPGSEFALRCFNEMIHRTSMQLRQALGRPQAGYPDDVYLDILKKSATTGDRSDALRWAVTRALHPGTNEPQ